MSFPDYDSLKQIGRIHKFRDPHKNEPEAKYRQALANYVEPIDRIESHEIRTGKGWDMWNDAEQMEMLQRSIIQGDPHHPACHGGRDT